MQRDRRQAIKVGIKGWLDHISSVTGLKMTPLAKKSGLHPQTLLRAIDLDDPHILSTDSIDKIVKANGVAPPRLEGEGPVVPGFAEPEISRIEKPGDITLPQGQIEHFRVHGRALEGTGLIPGDQISVHMGAAPRAGDLVVAQVYDLNRDTAETVIRRYDPPYLTTETLDPEARRKPLLLDGERVHIMGVVVRREWVREAS